MNQVLSWSEFLALIAEAASNTQAPAALSCEVLSYAMQAIASRETLADAMTFVWARTGSAVAQHAERAGGNTKRSSARTPRPPTS